MAGISTASPAKARLISGRTPLASSCLSWSTVYPPPLGPAQPGVALEGRVDLQEAVVRRPAAVAEEHLDDAEALVHRLEEGAVALVAVPLGVGGALELGAVAHDLGEPAQAAVLVL